MRNVTLICFFFLMMISCVSHKGMITSSTVIPDDKKTEYVDIAVGYSKISSFMGIGGAKNDALVNQAKRNLFITNTLENGQSFENLTLDMKTTLFWPYKKVEAMVTADVVERETSTKINYNQYYKDFNSKNCCSAKNYISLSESVLFYDNKGVEFPGRVVKIGDSRVTLFYVDAEGEIRIQNVGYENVFKINNLDALQSKVGFKLGESIKYSFKNSNGKLSEIEGVIVGLNSNYAKVKFPSGFESVRFEKLIKK
jgi:hypothetical protein